MNKYRNKPVTIDGIWFQSTKEGNRYSELKMLERVGLITDLELQPKFGIAKKVKWNDRTLRGIFYVADFMYRQDSETIVEDVKSEATRELSLYILKRQLFLLQYGNKYKFIET